MQILSQNSLISSLLCNPKIWKFLSIFILMVAISVRIFQFIFHKDLWLDEAMLSATLYHKDFSEIFFSPLPHLQAAPLGFLAVTKLLCLLFGYSEYSLYFFPMLCGIASLILAFKIANVIYGGGSLLVYS
ncbi:hypothetical protein CQA66_05885 [Helicobacter aurati]|uniref:Glycosyltransferase RgtA/B/C/D-like domain-containing protein n=1 Tax=Helicobacter aurati TaxID=137778 RepID=A0A3D8J2K9_9HELI|nr:hypothetical protein [Helicobacter aurati]RDU71633.1 hypothetical protein CQA66_05885 [Helicobacter aurati]